MYYFKFLESRNLKSRYQQATLLLKVQVENLSLSLPAFGVGFRHSLCCGNITPISASFCTVSFLCLCVSNFSLPFLTMTSIIGFGAYTTCKMISFQDSYHTCKDPLFMIKVTLTSQGLELDIIFWKPLFNPHPTKIFLKVITVWDPEISATIII